MATFTEQLRYLITGNSKDAVRAFREVRESATKDLGGAEAAMGGYGAKAKNLGAGLKAAGSAFLGVGGTTAAFDMLGQGIDAASQLEQSVGALESVFGDASKVIEDFGRTAADSAGLSRSEVNQLAAVMGAQLKGMGFSAQEAAEKVVVLQKRAADMAATFGGSTADAVLALTSTLRGEHERIERYGVSLRQSEIDARAAAMGLDTTSAAAQKNARAVASLEIILDSTSDTAGQFAREGDTAAGSQARFNATLENLKATLGEGILPAVAAFTDGLGLLAESAEKVTTAVGIDDGLSGAIRGFVKAMPGLGGLVQLKDGLSDTGDEAEEAGEQADEAEPKVGDLGAAIDTVTAAARDAVPALETYKSALDANFGASIELSEATSNFADTQSRVREELSGTGKTVRSSTEDIVTYQEALDDSLGSVLDATFAHEDAADAVRELAEALGQAGVGSENSADFMDRFYGRAEQGAEDAGKTVREATADAVRAAKDEVDAMAESGEIADTAAARKQALLDKLADLKEQFPAVAGEIDRYIGRVATVSDKLPTAEQRTRDLTDANHDLERSARDLVEAAADQVEALANSGEIADTAAARHRALRDLLDELKVKFPELSGIIATYVADVNQSWLDFGRNLTPPPGARPPGAGMGEDRYNPVTTVNLTQNIYGSGLNAIEIAQQTALRTQRALVGSRVG